MSNLKVFIIWYTVSCTISRELLKAETSLRAHIKADFACLTPVYSKCWLFLYISEKYWKIHRSGCNKSSMYSLVKKVLLLMETPAVVEQNENSGLQCFSHVILKVTLNCHHLWLANVEVH